MSSNFRVHELWPKPIYENNIDVKSKWIDKVKNFEYQRMDFNNGDFTIDKKILNKLPDLKKEILKNVYLFTEKYLKIIDTEFYFTTSWVNRHYPNDWAQDHMHENSLLSGVYYFKTEENSGNIVFLKGHNQEQVFPSALTPNYSEYNYTNGTNITVCVESGKLLIFPSNLIHKVLENKSDKERYSLAFNLFCKGTFGQDENKLEL
jgi:uncharacterized protein (TIGR02466 family)